MDIQDPRDFFFSCITELSHSCANIWFEFLKTTFKTKGTHTIKCYIPHTYLLTGIKTNWETDVHMAKMSLRNQHFKYLHSPSAWSILIHEIYHTQCFHIFSLKWKLPLSIRLKHRGEILLGMKVILFKRIQKPLGLHHPHIMGHDELSFMIRPQF